MKMKLARKGVQSGADDLSFDFERSHHLHDTCIGDRPLLAMTALTANSSLTCPRSFLAVSMSSSMIESIRIPRLGISHFHTSSQTSASCFTTTTPSSVLTGSDITT